MNAFLILLKVNNKEINAILRIKSQSLSEKRIIKLINYLNDKGYKKVNIINIMPISSNEMKSDLIFLNSLPKISKRTSIDFSLIKEIVDYLNEKTNSNYRADSKSTVDIIGARINDGFTKQDFFDVIDYINKTWTDKKMKNYIRPSTIFSNKFESYLNNARKYDKSDKAGYDLDEFEKMSLLSLHN